MAWLGSGGAAAPALRTGNRPSAQQQDASRIVVPTKISVLSGVGKDCRISGISDIRSPCKVGWGIFRATDLALSLLSLPVLYGSFASREEERKRMWICVQIGASSTNLQRHTEPLQ